MENQKPSPNDNSLGSPELEESTISSTSASLSEKNKIDESIPDDSAKLDIGLLEKVSTFSDASLGDGMLVFGSPTSRKPEVKSALFEFGQNIFATTDINAGFESADSTDETEFSTREAVQRAVDLMDKATEEEKEYQVEGCTNKKDNDGEHEVCDENKVDTTTNTHKADVCMDTKNMDESCDSTEVCRTGTIEQSESVSCVHKNTEISASTQEIDNEAKENNVDIDNIDIAFKMDQITKDQKENDNNIKISEEEIQNVSHVADTVLENKDPNGENKSNTHHNESSKISKGESCDVEIAEKDHEMQLVDSSMKYNDDVENENIQNISKNENELQVSKILGNGLEIPKIITTKNTSDKKILGFEDNLSSPNSRVEYIEKNIDGTTLAVTLENYEASVFEEEEEEGGITDDFVQHFLKPLKDDDKTLQIEESPEVKRKKRPKEFKLDDAMLSSDEDTDESDMDCDVKGEANINKSKDGFKLDDAVISSDEENSQPSKDCSLKSQTMEQSSDVELMEVEEDKPTEEDSNIVKQGVFKINDSGIKKCNEVNNLITKQNKTENEIDEQLKSNDNSLNDNFKKIKENNTISIPNSTEESDKEMNSSEEAETIVSSDISSKVSGTMTDIENSKSSNLTNSLTDLLQSVLTKNEEFRRNISSELGDSEKPSVNMTTENADTDSEETEVICLVDDEDDDVNKRKKPLAALKCVNPNCMSGEDLGNPAMFVLTYFGLKRSKGQLVCAECFNMVVEHQEKLATMLKEGKPLFTANFPNHRDVILLDSDEESFSDDEDNLSDDTMEMIRENLDDVITESLVKYGLDHQIREACDFLNNKIDTLEDETKELDERFNQVQKTLDEYRKSIYEDFNQPIKELDAVSFTDCEIPPMPIIKSRLQNQLYNKQLMKRLRIYEQEQNALHQSPSSARTIATKKVTYISQSSYDNVTQDVIAVHSEMRNEPPPNLPPPGVLMRPKLKVGDQAYTMKSSYFGIWLQCRVLEVIPRNTTEVPGSEFEGDKYIIELIDIETDPSTETYRVRIDNVKKNCVRTVTGKYLAYSQPSKVQLKVGTRVIAIFREEEDPVSASKTNYYVGVVAEPPKSTNKYRYLVFFDDGYTQYCPHDNILVVVSSSKNVWEDIHPEPKEFIKNYIQQYPERPMVKMSQGQVVKVEWNGRWWIVRVVEVDASLVKVHFDADRRTEWIYRGSTRLGPMYQELAAAKERQSGSLLRSRGFGFATHKSDMPYVEYTRGDGDDKREEDKDTGDDQTEEQPVIPTRSVARKSTAKKPAEPFISNTVYPKPLVSQVPLGNVTQRTLKNICRSIRFRPHQCNEACVAWTDYSPAAGRKFDPLVKPLVFGFSRLTMTFRGKTTILYRAPCGRMIRSQQEMLCYLQATRSSLTIDLFDFDFWVNVLNQFEEGKCFGRIEDLSYGKEHVPISCVNELDHSMPQYVQYMTARQPAKDVNLNLEPEFLVGCDCKDDCEDRSKCSCWKLTMEGKMYNPDGDLDPLFGYQYRRLPERIATGIYECNSRCKCSATCQNRVAQQPLSCRLQLFKTPKKGWGIRCLHDIPRGTFICIYVGFLLTEQEANEGGKTYGDEYLAELDYIESVENLKEGYESEAKEPSDFEDDDDDNSMRRLNSMDRDFDQDQLSPDSDMEMSQLTSSSSRSHQEDIRLRLRRRTTDDSDKDSMRKQRQDEDTISISDDETDPGNCGKCRRSLDDVKDTIKCQACINSFHIKCTPLQTVENVNSLGPNRSAWICPKCDALVRKPQTFNANITENEDFESNFPSVRELYGPNENVYIMDAKTHGNIGRYLNHSCSPNVFVQNVFVDTHDLRFPWVAFFANQYISAGTELTWDYNYDVGSVPGKVMLCYCNNSNCRGRLL